MKKFLKKSDKGFSLVELIVVIAIMAVLIGVIAPAFLKYVGKSKESAKATNLDELRKAANTVLADSELGTLSDNAEMKVTITSTGASNDTIKGEFVNLLEDSLGGFEKLPDGVTYEITVTGSVTDGYSATVTETGATPTATPK